MGLVNLKDVKYRQESHQRPYDQLYDKDLFSHSGAREYLPPTIKKQSVCEIEVDAWASDIQNREANEHDIDINPGLAAIWAEEEVRKILVGFKGEDSQSILLSSPRRTNLQPTDNDILQMQRFLRQLLVTSQNVYSASIDFDRSSYPVELHDEFNLLDASHLEKHIGYSSFRGIKYSGEDAFSQNQNSTLGQSAFEADDIPLVDILENLAQEHKTDEQVDGDSILGSHCSVALNEYKSDEEDEDEVSDFNLTTIDIHSLSLNSELTSLFLDKPESTASESIPQFDGADDLRKKESPEQEKNISKKRKKEGDRNKLKSNIIEKEKLRMSDSCEDTFEISERDFDRISPRQIPGFDTGECKSTLSEALESTNHSKNVKINHSLIIEEKLICDYKISKERELESYKKEVIVNHKDRSKTQKGLIFNREEESAFKISDHLSLSPNKVQRSPRKSFRSPKRNYSSLSITITPSKKKQESNKQKLFRNVKDNESSKNAQLEQMSVFTQECTPIKIVKEISDAEINKKILMPQDLILLKSSDHKVSQGNTFELSHRSRAVKVSEKLFLTPTSKDKGNCENEGLSLSTKLEFSKKVKFEKNVGNDDIYGKKCVFNKNQLKKCFENLGILNDAQHERKAISQGPNLLQDIDNAPPYRENNEEADSSRSCSDKELLTTNFTEFTSSQANFEYKINKKSVSFLKSKRLLAITTQFRAPTRQNIVESFQNYGIPACKNEEPFYSNHNDIRAQKNTAHQIMNQKGMTGLPSFKSEIRDITGIKLCRRIKINEFQTSNVKLETVNIKRRLAERRLITITPLHLPAHKREINKWKKAKKSLKHEKKKDIVNTNGLENRIKLNNLSNPDRNSLDSLINDPPLYGTLNSSEIKERNKQQEKKIGGMIFEKVDFSIDKTQTLSDVERKNLQNAKAITTVSLYLISC